MVDTIDFEVAKENRIAFLDGRTDLFGRKIRAQSTLPAMDGSVSFSFRAPDFARIGAGVFTTIEIVSVKERQARGHVL
jgi:hypothetical protein